MTATPDDPALLEEFLEACRGRGLTAYEVDGEIFGPSATDCVAVLRELGFTKSEVLDRPRPPKYQDRQVPVIRRRR